jgi:hypothetical protein
MVPELARETSFKFIIRPEPELLQLQCNRCGTELNVRDLPENYFFRCIGCSSVGNLPGVLARIIDANPDMARDEKYEALKEILASYPYPDSPPPPMVARRG